MYADSIESPTGTRSRARVLDSRSAVVFSRGRELGLLRRPGDYLLLSSGDNTIIARRFDRAKLQVQGDPVPVASQAFWGTNDARVGVSAAETGAIAITPMFRADQEVSLLTRDGRALDTAAPPGSYYSPAFSHDGRKIAVSRREPGGQAQNIWILDPERSSSARLTTTPGWHGLPVWSADNSELIYAAVEGDTLQRALYRQDLNGVRKPTRILAPQPVTSPYDWSRDGQLAAGAVTVNRSISSAPMAK